MSNSNPGLYFKWVPNVNAALTVMNLASNGSMQTSFRQHYNDSAKTALEFCSHDLKRIRSKQIFSETDRKSLYEEASTLQQNILESKDLDVKIKSFILDKLQDILNAIAYYDFTGDEGIIKAAERATGACMMRVAFKHSKDRDKNCTDFIKLLYKAMEIVVLAKAFGEISLETIKFLSQ